MQPGPGGSGKQGFGAAIACGELHRGPKAYRFHGHLLVIRKVRAQDVYKRQYLDTCLDLPWNTFTVDDLDISRAQQILDRDHYGLKKVKDRILETLAVRKPVSYTHLDVYKRQGSSAAGQRSRRTP